MNLSFFFGVTFSTTVVTTGNLKKIADKELEICSSYIPQNIKKNTNYTAKTQLLN